MAYGIKCSTHDLPLGAFELGFATITALPVIHRCPTIGLPGAERASARGVGYSSVAGAGMKVRAAPSPALG